MEIIKRTGQTEAFRSIKIADAMAAAFKSVGTDTSAVEHLTAEIEEELKRLHEAGNRIHIETIQDLVEKTLIKHNYPAEVKSFILYRENRTKKRRARKRITETFVSLDLDGELKSIQKDFPDDEYSLDALYHKYSAFKKEEASDSDALSALIRAAVELTTQEAPNWEYIASRLLMIQFKIKLNENLSVAGIESFYGKIKYLTDEKLYGSYILEQYSKSEIDSFEEVLKRCDSGEENRNALLTYSALDLLLRRYVIRTRSNVPLETPQEMFMGIAMHLAMNEKTERSSWVLRFYDMLSKLQVTVATPTLSNARKPYHQLSSCFIDTVPDSLEGIYRSINNFAQVSKFGGGMGLYFGKVRASGSPIRGFQGAAGGIIRWIKLANDTAVAVDQLGVRQGSVAVYLDVWHKDIPEFLQLRTNNGDDRMKAHDVFPAVCYPDLFWKTAKENIDAPWYLLCPHEVLKIKGYALEDFYGEEWEARYRDCINDSRIHKRSISVKELVRLILKSAVETGTPFAFFRDTVNKANPNPHTGMIYCSNLCTEIAQNMSAIEFVKREIKDENGDTLIAETTKAGDFVVCNLASLVLGNIDTDKEGELETITESAVRALDNVIDLNFYPLTYAEITNKRYRSIGLGTSGYHHILAKKGIVWESEAHLAFADKLFERINRAAVKASASIAAEKGSYSLFEGSDWNTGAYFEKRGYTGDEWNEVKKAACKGMRNAYLIAVAPTSSTSIIAGTSAGVDPIMNRYFLEEKKGSIMPRVAPGLNRDTFWLYKSAHTIDQSWSLRAAGVRQRHIDQAQSVNLYITNTFTMRQVMDLYILAWEEGVKSIYYVRSKSLEVEECESCAG
ncbi:ribonucleoside-diphosphate reductase subunit alpha [Treponema sp. HNW]|uniref:ribonucleoside-diphosphate reductase subunit alpha n=1 Tax=Treponema sp. HNW TaxID=3116654 RepID=UPI003D0F86F3